ncbi:MAG TPA: hypothetical protein PL001_13080 [Candidatus Kryptobacter bacterium]|nr:hypothetical protein [Candidatus Kryptobacter bacterium]
MVIVDLRRDVSNADIDALARDMGVRGTEAAFMKMTFKHFLRKGAYTRDEIERLIDGTTFSNHTIEEKGVTLSIRLGKHVKPVVMT